MSDGIVSKHYVIYCLERLQDGIEEICWIVPSLEAAEAKITKLREEFSRHNLEFRLFHLGAEIPLPPREEVLG